MLAVLAAVAPSGDPDLWWHLATGRLALEEPARLAYDPFSYSRAGAPWPYHDLVADVILYRGYAWLGYAWFAVLKVMVVGVQSSALWLIQRRGQRSALLVLTGTAALLVAVPLVERPNLFTVACFPLTLALLERARRVLHREPRALVLRLTALLLVGWAWICLHRAGALAIALTAGLFGWTLLLAILPSRGVLGERPRRAALIATGLAAVSALGLGFLNPSGGAALTSSIGVAGADLLRSTISEWQHLPVPALVRAFPAALSLTGLAVLVLVLRSRAHELTLFHVVLLAVGAAGALDSVRFVPYLAATSVLVCALGLGHIALAASTRAALRTLPALVFVAAAAVVWSTRVSPFSLGEDTSRTAHRAVRFLEEHALSGKVANTLEHGGFLIWRAWPRVQVFIDGRNETVYPPAFVARAIASDHDRATFAALRAEDGATVVVAGNAPGRMTHRFLASDPAWAMVDWGEAATVWLHVADHPELAALRYTRLDPRALDRSVARAFEHGPATGEEVAALGAELERLVLGEPRSVRALSALAIFHHLRGDATARDRVLQRLDELAPEHPAVRELRRRFGSSP